MFLEIYIIGRRGTEQSGIKLFYVISCPYKDVACGLSSLDSGSTY